MAFQSITFFVFSAVLLAAALDDGLEEKSSEVANNLSVTRSTNNIHDCINTNTTKTIVYTQTINVERSLLWWVTKTWTYPTNGVGTDTITCIVVTDQDETGAYASITDGGIGNTYVEITFKSAWNKGLNFKVQLFTDASS